MNPNFAQSDVGATPEESVISRINKEEEHQVKQEDTIKLEDLQVPGVAPVHADIILGDSGIHFNMNQKRFTIRYRRIVVISLIISIISLIALIVLRTYNSYLHFAAQPVMDTQYSGYVAGYKSVSRILDDVLHISDYATYVNLWMLGTSATDNVNTILRATTINYIQKKDVLQTALTNFSPVYISNKQKLEDLKQETTKYGFFSKELFDLLTNEEYVTSIKDSLLSLEMIKFSSAMKVFSYLDTFISSLANVLNMSQTEVAVKMNALTARGEKDISVYLNNCYLNPYEVDYDCNLVGDFDRYYALIDKTQPIDRPFFKKLMQYIDIKLEQTELPSFAITFQKFDPTQKQISFKVDVNTFQQDEAALTKKWIINPHIFIVTNLLNLIKQSLFVISENVDAKQLKITPKVIKIWSTVFTVNNSTMNFILPIQKSTEREITDYTQSDLLNTSQ